MNDRIHMATHPTCRDEPDEVSSLMRSDANFTPLSPLFFLPRAAAIFPQRTSIVFGKQTWTWAETHERALRLASALVRRGLAAGDVVAILAPNIPAMIEAHFGVPMAGAVLHAINIRLGAEEIAFQLAHGGAKLLLVDREFREEVRAALSLLADAPAVIYIGDQAGADLAGCDGDSEYEALLAEGTSEHRWHVADECGPIALNYTSGTTGDPKGVVTHHRGAYLNALAQIITWSMPQNPVYLWTLPMFHCNGWCFPWAVAAQGGTNVCLRRIEPALTLDLIGKHGVTHMCGAPIVYSMLIDEMARQSMALPAPVSAMVAGAAPPSAMIQSGGRAGFVFTHVYGLTEVYGPSAVCVRQPEWAARSHEEQARLMARQGMAMLSQERMQVVDPATMIPVPPDGRTVGEIMFRGNATMTGYLRNAQATEEAFAGGWFHTGDLAVLDPDGYARIVDRSKDVIISGGENVSSLEVEDVLHQHPAVSLAAVVAKPDARWGEIPCAFVEIRDGHRVDQADLQGFCRSRLAGYKTPRLYVFGPIPKTSTGKVQKNLLRETALSIGAPMAATIA